MRCRYGARVTGVDFKDLPPCPTSTNWSFTVACSTSRTGAAPLRPDHDVALPRTRLRSAADAAVPRHVSSAAGRSIVRGAAARQHLSPVPRALARPAGAAAHGLYTQDDASSAWRRPGSRWWTTCPTERSRRYFYLFAGAAFKLLRGRGLNPSLAIYPYFLGQLLLSPLLLSERRLNLAMQTAVCRRTRMTRIVKGLRVAATGSPS